MCGGCSRTLRSQLKSERGQCDRGAGVAGTPTSSIRPVSPYASAFERGPRGGALVPLNAVLRIESFLPYYEEATGEVWPWMPMPFLGTETIHIAGGKPSTAAQEFRACQRGECDCDLRPSGWLLPRAVARAVVGVSDAFLAEFGRGLPGCLPTWELQFSTPEFMKQVVFDPTFTLPTRASSRAARGRREASRGRICKSPPLSRNRRRHT